MNNRAIEFLDEAYSLLGYFGNDDRARLLVRLAAGEVVELLDRLAELEAARLTSPTSPDRHGVLVMNAQPLTPARIVEGRAALPGNGKRL